MNSLARQRYQAIWRTLHDKFRRVSAPLLDDVHLAGILPVHQEAFSPDDILLRLSAEEVWATCQAKLSPRDRAILEARYLGCLTCEQVGKEWGVTRERCRQIEAKALRRAWRIVFMTFPQFARDISPPFEKFA